MIAKTTPRSFEISNEVIPNDSARTFDNKCRDWHFDLTFNYVFLRAQQNYFNDRLQVVGSVFLNEVYDALGFPRTKLGAVVGWLRPGVVDFGIVTQPRAFDLNFNVQGVILDHLENTT